MIRIQSKGEEMMKHLGIVFVVLMTVLTFSPDVSANEIINMEMDIEINEDGSATVTETRQADMTEGTENYIVFDEADMDAVEVTDFSVEGFTEQPDWDPDASLEEKAGEYGVLETDDGIELVWGIGEYGEQEYVVNYTLENVVRNLEDGQSLYWNFDTFTGLPVDDFTMNVSSEVPLADELQFWGFGFEGDINRGSDGVTWTADETLTDGNDAVLLMHFPQATYNTDVTDDGTLEAEAEAAMDGSIYDDGSMSGWAIGGIVGGIGAALALVIIFVQQFISRQQKAGHIDSGATIHRRNKGLEAEKPPAVEDYAGIAFVLMHLRMGHFEETFQAYMMKWMDEGRISIEIDRKEGQKLDKGETEIIIHDYETLIEGYSHSFKDVKDHLKQEVPAGGYEPLLWWMLLDAADDSGFIDDKSLTKWSKKNAKAVGAVADEITVYSKRWLEANGYFEFRKDKIFGITVPISVPTEKGEALLDELVQYKNYIEEDYGRIYEVDDNYRNDMIWSVLVGEGDDIRKHLLKVTKDDAAGAHPVWMHYYYGPMLASQSWTKGLGQGGFHSSASSAASGGGGATGAGGGAGAGGGGGGGAR